MQILQKQPYSKSLSALLAVLLITYALGTAYFVTNLYLMKQTSMAASTGNIPSFALVFLLGAASTWAVVRGRRIGVYGLILTWAITAMLSLISPADVSSAARFAGILIAALFVYFIRPVWKEME